MAIGDKADVYSRLQGVLPRWFGDLSTAPLIAALLQAFATTQSYVYSLIAYAALQVRIKTATDGWLDMIAADFFGPTFYRRAGQTDNSFRAAIVLNLFRERGTRASVIKILTDLTGRAPLIIEFNRPLDTGVWGGPYLGYGLAGAYGSFAMGTYAMVTAYRPFNIGTAPFGYIPTDAEIYAAVDSVRPAGYTILMNITN